MAAIKMSIIDQFKPDLCAGGSGLAAGWPSQAERHGPPPGRALSVCLQPPIGWDSEGLGASATRAGTVGSVLSPSQVRRVRARPRA